MDKYVIPSLLNFLGPQTRYHLPCSITVTKLSTQFSGSWQGLVLGPLLFLMYNCISSWNLLCIKIRPWWILLKLVPIFFFFFSSPVIHLFFFFIHLCFVLFSQLCWLKISHHTLVRNTWKLIALLLKHYSLWAWNFLMCYYAHCHSVWFFSLCFKLTNSPIVPIFPSIILYAR